MPVFAYFTSTLKPVLVKIFTDLSVTVKFYSFCCYKFFIAVILTYVGNAFQLLNKPAVKFLISLSRAGNALSGHA